MRSAIGNNNVSLLFPKLYYVSVCCVYLTALFFLIQILVTTGGASWLAESMQGAYLQCPEIDIVAIHMYGTGDFDASKLQGYVQAAQQANKKLMVQEWCVWTSYFHIHAIRCPY